MSTMILTNKHFAICLESVSKFSPKFNYGKAIFTSEIKEHFATLKVINELSYVARYEDEEVYHEEFKTVKETFSNMFELIKALQCIRYNIEASAKDLKVDDFKFKFEFKESIQWLDDMINTLVMYQITNTEEYKNADWSIAK